MTARNGLRRRMYAGARLSSIAQCSRIEMQVEAISTLSEYHDLSKPECFNCAAWKSRMREELKEQVLRATS
jgi:hypothetical protein